MVETAKQELEYKIILSESINLKDPKYFYFVENLRKQPFVQEMKVVSKEEALEKFKNVGSDFQAAMNGINPFPTSINLHLNPEYIQPDSIQSISKMLLENEWIQEINYPIHLIDTIDQRTRWAAQVAFGVGIILVIVTYLLIQHTIKLAVFSQRLMIRTMQLIGATNSFIQRPYLRMGFFQGFFSGVVADGLLLGMLWAFHTYLFRLDVLFASRELLILLCSLVLLGVLLGWVSSRLALRKYLNKTLDQIM